MKQASQRSLKRKWEGVNFKTLKKHENKKCKVNGCTKRLTFFLYWYLEWPVEYKIFVTLHFCWLYESFEQNEKNKKTQWTDLMCRCACPKKNLIYENEMWGFPYRTYWYNTRFFHTPTKRTWYISYIYILPCYQVCPTYYGVLYTILREKFVSLLRTVIFPKGCYVRCVMKFKI